MKRLSVYALLLITAIAVAVWWLSPTQVLKRRTKDFLETITLEEGSGQAARRMKSLGLTRYLAERVALETPTIEQANGTFDRQDLDAAFAWLCSAAKRASFEVEEFQDIQVSGDTARVNLILTGVVVLPVYRPADGRYEVIFEWQKEKDGWRLTRTVWTEAG